MENDFEAGVKATGRITSGLYIVTCGPGEMGTGFLASLIQQISFNPMIVAISVNPQRPARALITDHRRFCINVLGPNEKHLMKHFAKGFSPEARAFDGVKWKTGPNGVAWLEEASAVIDCEWTGDSVQPGDHILFFGRVVGGEVRNGERPLTHVRASGRDY